MLPAGRIGEPDLLDEARVFITSDFEFPDRKRVRDGDLMPRILGAVHVPPASVDGDDIMNVRPARTTISGQSGSRERCFLACVLPRATGGSIPAAVLNSVAANKVTRKRIAALPDRQQQRLEQQRLVTYLRLNSWMGPSLPNREEHVSRAAREAMTTFPRFLPDEEAG